MRRRFLGSGAAARITRRRGRPGRLEGDRGTKIVPGTQREVVVVQGADPRLGRAFAVRGRGKGPRGVVVGRLVLVVDALEQRKLAGRAAELPPLAHTLAHLVLPGALALPQARDLAQRLDARGIGSERAFGDGRRRSAARRAPRSGGRRGLAAAGTVHRRAPAGAARARPARAAAARTGTRAGAGGRCRASATARAGSPSSSRRRAAAIVWSSARGPGGTARATDVSCGIGACASRRIRPSHVAATAAPRRRNRAAHTAPSIMRERPEGEPAGGASSGPSPSLRRSVNQPGGIGIRSRSAAARSESPPSRTTASSSARASVCAPSSMRISAASRRSSRLRSSLGAGRLRRVEAGARARIRGSEEQDTLEGERRVPRAAGGEQRPAFGEQPLDLVVHASVSPIRGDGALSGKPRRGFKGKADEGAPAMASVACGWPGR